MKANIETTGHNASVSSSVSLRSTQDGKIHKTRQTSPKEEENEEIKAYLTKLQELVPFMPKNRKLSKLEVVTYVIEYIRDLRTTLGLAPQSRLPTCGLLANSRDISDPFEFMTQANLSLSVLSTSSSSSFSSPTRTSAAPHSFPNHQPQSRLPLVVISTSNTVSLNGSCASQEIPQLMEKSTIDLDTRPLSC